MVTLPTFLGIGAPKCGTTWLAECLREHPDVYVPEVKEVTYFSSQKKLARGDAWYLSHFDGARGAKAVGEFSVTYLSGGAGVAERIASLAPDVRLLAVLRDPVERAFSHYRWLIQLGKLASDVPFGTALLQSPDIVEDSLYFKGLEPFLARFPLERLHLVSYDRLKKAPESVVADAYRFIGVDEHYIPSVLSRRVGKTISPRFRALERLRVDLYRFARRHNMTGLISFVKRSGLSAFYREFNDKRGAQSGLDGAQDAEVFELFRKDLSALREATGFDSDAWCVKGMRRR